jgi:hypothetical protein
MKHVFLLLSLISFVAFSQSFKISTTAKKMVSIQLGYSFNTFVPSTFSMKGSYVDLQIKEAQFSPIKDKFKLSTYFSSPMKLGIGVNIRKYSQVMLGLDNFKYYLSPQVLNLNGSVANNYDQVGGLEGEYSNTLVSTDTLGFGISMNNVRFVSVQWNQLIPLAHYKKHVFGIVGFLGAGIGALHTTSSIDFGPAYQGELSNLSGFGGMLNLGLRMEFFSNFYLFSNLSGGGLFQRNIQTDLSEITQKAFHKMGYGQLSIGLGTTFFPGKKKNCDCPHF